MTKTTGSKAKRRLAVVKDAIAQLKGKCYITGNFGYVSLPGKHEKARPNGQLQTFLNSTNESCGVCAKGGLFLSLVRKENEFKNSDDISHGTIMDRLTADGLFERENLNLVEAYYENYHLYKWEGVSGWSVYCCGAYYFTCVGFGFTEKEAEKLAKYHNNKMDNYAKKYPTKDGSERTDRLLAILENMAENGGVFKP
jgi:hypothetical protein